MNLWDRRSVSTGLGAAGANLWLPPSADALGLADDKIKVIRYTGRSPLDGSGPDRARWRDAYDPNRFVDPEGYLAAVERLEGIYREQLARERAALR